MKKLTLLAAALSATAILAQDAPGPRAPREARTDVRQSEHRRDSPGPRAPREAREPQPQRQALMPNSGIWVAKMLSNPKALDAIGVTDEGERGKISKKLAELNAKGAEIERQIRELSLEQAELFKKALSDKSADGGPLLEKVGEIASLRAEQGRLSVSAILFLRDTLTQEQLDRAVKLIDERGRERGRMRSPSPFDGERPPRDREGGARKGKGHRGDGAKKGPGHREEGKMRRNGGGRGETPPPPEGEPGADAED